MAYSDFTLETVLSKLGITTMPADLFPDLIPLPVPVSLEETLRKRTALALISEKARSEFIVVPILMACRDMSQDRLAIYSGQRLDVNPERGLVGECDFILALGPSVPPLRAPILTILEAKKNDVELGLGQCIAQMVAARLFNQADEESTTSVYGCVTTGEIWQFLQLKDSTAWIDSQRFYLDNTGKILAAIQRIWEQQIQL